MKHLLMITMLATLGFSGCAKKAPGTNPTDMTAAGHRRECAKHRENATAANQRAAEASTSEFPKAKYPAQEEAKKENEIANQHADAAHTVDKIVVAEGGQQPAADPACE
jgi:hypothetical protein